MNSLPHRFYRGARRWERLLYRITAVVLALLVVAQLAMLNGRVRLLLSRVEFMEGSPYQEHREIE